MIPATGGVVDELLEPVTVVPERTMPTTVGRRNAWAAELPVLRSSRTLVRGTEPHPQLEPEHFPCAPARRRQGHALTGRPPADLDPGSDAGAPPHTGPQQHHQRQRPLT